MSTITADQLRKIAESKVVEDATRCLEQILKCCLDAANSGTYTVTFEDPKLFPTRVVMELEKQGFKVQQNSSYQGYYANVSWGPK